MRREGGASVREGEGSDCPAAASSQSRKHSRERELQSVTREVQRFEGDGECWRGDCAADGGDGRVWALGVVGGGIS